MQQENIQPPKLIQFFKILFHLVLQDSIEFIYVFITKKTNQKNNSNVHKLNKDGITIINDFLDPENCTKIKNSITSFLNRHAACPENSKSTVDFRNTTNTREVDKGMIDIFNIEKELPELSQFISNEKILTILESTTNRTIYPLSIHAYINTSVKKTRGFHVDDIQPPVYKAFIYLTDVNNINDGPYEYIKKSHKLSLTRYFNLILNLFQSQKIITDIELYPKKNKITCTAPKGTLIISNQTGIHRGHPQQENHSRVALVLSYLVVSPLNHIHTIFKPIVNANQSNLN